MKRDWDVIREWLLRIDALEPSEAMKPAICLNLKKDDDIVDYYHLKIMNDLGLIELSGEHLTRGVEGLSQTVMLFYVSGLFLTWRGADVLDLIRDEKRWEMIKKSDNISGEIKSYLKRQEWW